MDSEKLSKQPMTALFILYIFIYKNKENLLSPHPCLEDLEGQILLWFPDSEQVKKKKEVRNVIERFTKRMMYNFPIIV